MKGKVSIWLLFCLAIILSCSVDRSNGLVSEKKRMNLALSSDKNYSPHIVEEALKGDYDPYLKLFNVSDYQVGIASHRDGARSPEDQISYYSGENPFYPVTRAISQEKPTIISYINGIELKQKEIATNIATRSTDDIAQDVFGKIVSFRMLHASSEVKTRVVDETNPSDVDEFEMYIPKRIYVLDPAAINGEDNNPLCYFGDFVVRWNADEQNTNGVLIYVEWFGGMAFGNDIDNTSVQKVSIVPDTGEARIDPELFDGIPDTALCRLVLLRGSIENAQGEEYSYNLIGETHHMISFILIREIECQ